MVMVSYGTIERWMMVTVIEGMMYSLLSGGTVKMVKVDCYACVPMRALIYFSQTLCCIADIVCPRYIRPGDCHKCRYP